MSPEVTFEGSDVVWGTLKKIQLDENDTKILKKSHRTRINIEDERIEFQFKILPTNLTEKETQRTIILATELSLALSQLYQKNIQVTIGVKDCCQKGCFECTEFGKIKKNCS